MRAIAFRTPGGPEVLELEQWPDPEIESPTGLRVRLQAAGVNPIDTKLRQRGTFFPDQMPAILGCDGAGIVEQVGTAVKNFKVGDPVYFCQGGLGREPGTYAELKTIEQHCVAPKPKTLSFAAAAAVPLALITAWEALHDRADLQAGERVLIHAGAGGVGHLAIQLAKLKQAEVATTISTTAKAAFVKNLGAQLAIQYQQQDFVAAVLDWTHGQGVDLCFDTVGGATFARSVEAIKYGGDLVTLLEPSPGMDWKPARNRNLRVSFELMLTPMLEGLTAAQCHQAEILRQAADLIDSGKLRVHLDQTFPLAAAADAHRWLATGSGQGKVVLTI
jgi:NADPH:quinone reductase